MLLLLTLKNKKHNAHTHLISYEQKILCKCCVVHIYKIMQLNTIQIKLKNFIICNFRFNSFLHSYEPIGLVMFARLLTDFCVLQLSICIC